MMTTLNTTESERFERQARLTAAFVESAVGSSGMLHAVLTTIYRTAPEPLAHAQRVAFVARRIGEDLGLPERGLDDLERAAWVHDLGKLVVPDQPLRRANVVSPEDVLHWGQQVTIGAQIVGAVPFLQSTAALVLASRECFDGSGYPFGLQGDAIPLGSRILHLADTFDTLVTLCLALERSADAVNVELVKHAGTRFDPDVVATWLRSSDAPPSCGVYGGRDADGSERA
jgi:response regulator RpfG family c-di-GMP phosphodiesterase